MWIDDLIGTLKRGLLNVKISRRLTAQPFPDPPVSEIDGQGLMVTPWVKYPNLPLGSVGWRMGMGEQYLESYAAWYLRQPRNTQKQIWSDYPEPEDWSGYYRRLKRP